MPATTSTTHLSFDDAPITVPGRVTPSSLHADAERFEQTHSISGVGDYFRRPRGGEWFINPINWINIPAIRHQHFGGEERAQRTLERYDPIITAVAEDIHADPALVRAVMRMEVSYNPDIFGLGDTTGPMNVNYEVWGSFLAQHGITSAAALNTPETNIRAAALILARFDRLLEHAPGETPEMRTARIASLYGNTGEAQRHGVLPYGAMVARFYVEEVGTTVARVPIQHETEPTPTIAAALPNLALARSTAIEVA